jgi:hypothetical protein
MPATARDHASEAEKLRAVRDALERQYRLNAALESTLSESRGQAIVDIGPPAAHAPPPVAAFTTEHRSWWPAAPIPAAPLHPPPGNLCASLADRRVPVVAVAVFGLAGRELEAKVRQVSLQQRADMNFVPVFLTDSPSHGVFFRYGYAFEYCPSYRFGRNEDDALRARLRLLGGKWNFHSITYLSEDASKGPSDRSSALADGLSARPAVSAGQVAGGRQYAGAATADLAEQAQRIRESGLFDENWYLRTYPDVKASGEDPIMHYLLVGAREGRSPSELFDTAFYARQMARYGSADGG